MSNFNKQDVIKVAEALIEQSVAYDAWHHGNLCEYCGSMQLGKKLKHSVDCVVLIAQDLLTGGK